MIPIALVLTLVATLTGWGATPDIAREASQAEAAAVSCEDITSESSRTDLTVRVVNNTAKDYTFFASEIDCFDFSGTANPSQLDGLTIPAMGESTTYSLAARRVCPWVRYLPVPTWQARSANWTTGISASDKPSDVATFRSTISCQGNQDVSSMCKKEFFQSNESFPLSFENSMIRVSVKCEDSGRTTLTISTIY